MPFFAYLLTESDGGFYNDSGVPMLKEYHCDYSNGLARV